jgi:Trk K+ transport system NAD-binding subunit
MGIRVIIIGLNSYGIFLTEYLRDNDIEIVALDKDEERMNSVKEFVSRPIIGNATNSDVLKELGVEEADDIIVSLDSLETSVICVLHLQELNAKHIIARRSIEIISKSYSFSRCMKLSFLRKIWQKCAHKNYYIRM